MTDLQGAHVLVVGATGGLGSEISRALAGAGARLTLSGRRTDALDALAQELGECVVGTVAADLTEPGAPATVVERATSNGNGLSGVVYAAGVVAFGPLDELDDDVLDELLLTSFIAPVRVARAALPSLGKGAFLAHISAVVAEMPTTGMAAYSAAKAALTAFDTAMTGELRRRGIRVIDIRPPHTETGLADRPISGTAPKMPQGLQPAVVAARVVRAIVEDERDVPSTAFSSD